MTFVAAAFALAGGWVHLREWLDGYRDVPASAPGSAVVRLGFPVSAALAVLLTLALLASLRASRRLRWSVLGAAAVFEVASLVAVVLTRQGTLFGWTEPQWTLGAEQTALAAAGSLVGLVATAAIVALRPRRTVAATA